MSEKKKVITADHILCFGGLIGSMLVFISMGIHWVRYGTPFLEGIGLFGIPVIDTLLTIIWPLAMSLWGLSSIQKKKNIK